MFREPPYKRKRGNGARSGQYDKRGRHNGPEYHQRHKHWDEPSESLWDAEASSSSATKKEKPKRYQADELTQEDIWDDSALIAAWDAAVEEYESLNGPEKKWKEEPVNKSALWYAPPPKLQKENEESEESHDDEENDEGAVEEEQEIEADSLPIDFNTFVPSHDPTLGRGTTHTPAIGSHPHTIPMTFPNISTLTKDEIFEKAISSSYWAGYWTALYHASSGVTGIQNETDEEEVEADEMVHVEDVANTPQQTES